MRINKSFLRPLFSATAARSIGASVIAFSALGMSGCSNHDLPVPSDVFNSLHEQPVHSYTLLPILEKLDDGAIRPTGRLNLLYKHSEFSNPNAVNDKGEKGNLHCSSIYQVPAQLTNSGNVGIYYGTSGYRCGSNTFTELNLNGPTLNLPLSNGVAGCGGRMEELSGSMQQVCTFTPRAATSALKAPIKAPVLAPSSPAGAASAPV